MDVRLFLVTNPEAPLLEQPGEALSIMKRCLPRPLPWAVYRSRSWG
jgi:hypothetical protein